MTFIELSHRPPQTRNDTAFVNLVKFSAATRARDVHEALPKTITKEHKHKRRGEKERDERAKKTVPRQQVCGPKQKKKERKRERKKGL